MGRSGAPLPEGAMSYEPFALKYRPKTFHDVVGQEAVAATLQRAVSTGRVANAFLFCGSRGVGKTSMARILARALNCPFAGGGEPCNACETCRAVATGDDIDVIEIDGASNRGIDDIREIREAAGYVPSRSPYKIYIIDEVHMLTIQAFNALLKVLEEPPPHVKFVFATTDPTSLPDTILSRCQRHEFKRIGVEDIAGRLRHICTKENVAFEEEALEAIAAKAEGGLRDSVSLLDQVVSYTGGRVGLADLAGALGLLPREHLERIVEAVAEGDLGGVVLGVRATVEAGLDPLELLDETIGALHEFMVWHVLKDGGGRPSRHAPLFERLATSLSLDRVQYVLKILINAKGDIRRSGFERVQIELAFLKAARSSAFLPVDEILERLKSGVAPADPPRLAGEPRAAAATPGPKESVATARAAPEPPAGPPPAPGRREPTIGLQDVLKNWSKIAMAVRERKPPLAAALADAMPSSLDGARLVVDLPAAKKFQAAQLQSRESAALLADAFKSVVGVGLAVHVNVVNEQAALAKGSSQGVYEDPTVRKIIEHFDGGIINVEKKDG